MTFPWSYAKCEESLAHQNRTIAIASHFCVDGAKSPEIPQKEGVFGPDIAARNRKSLATFHHTRKSQCSIAFCCLGNRCDFWGPRWASQSQIAKKNRCDFGAQCEERMSNVNSMGAKDSTSLMQQIDSTTEAAEKRGCIITMSMWFEFGSEVPHGPHISELLVCLQQSTMTTAPTPHQQASSRKVHTHSLSFIGGRFFLCGYVSISPLSLSLSLSLTKILTLPAFHALFEQF